MAMQPGSKTSIAQRWEDYQPTKSTLVWACLTTAVVTMFVGFSWGGWVTGSVSRDAAIVAGDMARGELASTICVERFKAAPDSVARLAELKAITGTYQRQQFIEDGGWATMPGQKSSERLAAAGCAAALST